MSRISRLTRVSLLLAVFFALDKGVGFLRSILLARQFGFSHEYDAFNVANNIPDMLFALISGGALAMAFIPVLSEVLTLQGRARAWDLFSKIANLAFIVTGAFAILIALVADPLVHSQFGVAPGFSADQQDLVIRLMRLDLIATMIFAISGLVIAGLQANQHFLLPAMAPLLYNLGQIFGAVVLAPAVGYKLGPVQLPGFGLGIYGLVYGTILGAALHLGIQIPGLVRYGFRWIPALGLRTAEVQRVLRLMAPRLGTMAMIQLTFLARDNFASRLGEGSISALTLGYMLNQVPETLIGTAIGTALLPTLAELAAGENRAEFTETVQRAARVIVALCLPIMLVVGVGFRPVLAAAFHLGAAQTDTLLWTLRGFLVGLAGEALMEVAARSFYARQQPLIPLLTSALNLLTFVVLAALLYSPLGVAGISLAVALGVTMQGVVQLILLGRRMTQPVRLGSTFWRALAGGILGGAVTGGLGLLPFAARLPLPYGLFALAMGGAVALLPVWKEVRTVLKL